ncbi:hypothetical protein FQU75_16380 [Paenibacillus polymyxa]|nr:hypothetical protein FQU75_16380 [Paenibacillus polymyxa]
MSEVLNSSLKVFMKNARASLKELSAEFDILERKARGCFFIGQVLYNTEKGNEAIAPMFEEIFIDLFQSITSCLNGQYRLAYQSLRSSLELTVASVYFYDHPIEFTQWKNDEWDFQFSLIKEILSQSYAKALDVESPPLENQIRVQYRFLSQFVHGKYGFMTAAQDGAVLNYDQQRSLEFIENYEKVFSCIIDLFSYRFHEYFPAVIERYPYFRSFLP